MHNKDVLRFTVMFIRYMLKYTLCTISLGLNSFWELFAKATLRKGLSKQLCALWP